MELRLQEVRDAVRTALLRLRNRAIAARERGELRRVALAALYWLAVLLVAIAIVVFFVLILESRDEPGI